MPACVPSPPSTRSISRYLSSTSTKPGFWSPPVSGVWYCLPGEPIPTPDDVFGPIARISAPSSPNLASSSPNLSASSPNLPEQRDLEGCLVSDQLPFPVVDDLAPLSEALRSRLEAMASEPRTKRKVDRRQVLTDVVLELCDGRFITLRCLAELVNRKPDTLRDQYLKVLVRQRELSLAFPKTPNHGRQAYTTDKLATP
jgi:ATP-dependent DNA helicase RecG